MQRIERIVFFGTPAFAVPSLEALVEAGRRPALVVTQPARPAGRGRRLLEPPVATRASELGLAVEQVERVRAPEFVERLRPLAPDLAVVVAFGQIFPASLLELPRLGCLNLHASLLPRWRGAAPIAAAVAAGDVESGVTVQRMALELDAGPVYAERRTPIGEHEPASELAPRLARLGASLLLEVIEALELGTARAAAQDESGATYAPKPAARDLDPARTALALAREVRAYSPDPGVFLAARGERVKVLAARPGSAAPSDAPPGAVVAIGRAALVIAAGDGSTLELERVQRPGGRPVSGRDFANGLRLAAGDRLA